MKFGFALASQRVINGARQFDLKSMVDECVCAEQNGFSVAYTGERRATGITSYSHNPLLMSAYGLAKTDRLMFAAGLVVLPLHHPVTVIQDASTLEAFYPSRFRLVVGAGYAKADFDALGVSMKERGKRMEAGLSAIEMFRNGESGPIADPYRGIVPVRDETLRNSTLEVMVGAWTKIGVERAAKYGDGWMSGPLDTIGAIEVMAKHYRQECQRFNKKPYIILLREAWIGESDREAIETYGPYVLKYHQVYMERGHMYDPEFDPWIRDIHSPADLTLDHVIPDRVLCGSSETWFRSLTEWKERINPDEIVLRLRHFDGPEHESVLEAMRMIGSEIIPQRW